MVSEGLHTIAVRVEVLPIFARNGDETVTALLLVSEALTGTEA